MNISDIPLWLFGVDIVLLPAIFFAGGFMQGKRKAESEGDDGPIGAMVASVLALLAFMLAFTFSLATGRFDERRLLVVEEANAIGTAYLRADFLDEPGRTNMQNMLREYAQLRLHFYTDPAGMDAVLKKCNGLQSAMWKEVAGTAKKRPTPISALTVNCLNELIDLQEKRISAGVYSRVPTPIWLYLLVVSALAMSSVGYYCGKRASDAWAVAVILLACYSAVLFLAADLDRPQSGTLVTNLQPLIDVVQQIQNQ